MLHIDHLVVVADTLEQGVRWCESRFGVTPDAGGRHALMGTHNRLLRIAAPPGLPQAYLEIIAVDPDAPAPGRRRWFGMDDERLRELVRTGPRLVHWVMACPDITGQRDALLRLGVDPGEVLSAQRETPQGWLKWRITVPADGTPRCAGALPTLIEWTPGMHPVVHLPDRGLRLRSLTLRGVPPALTSMLNVPGVQWRPAPGAALSAVIDTPRGPVVLDADQEP